MQMNRLARRPILCCLVAFTLLVSYGARAGCGMPPSRPSAGNWCFLDGELVRVWWDDEVFPERRAKALMVVKETETTLWSKFYDLLGHRTPISDADKHVY